MKNLGIDKLNIAREPEKVTRYFYPPSLNPQVLAGDNFLANKINLGGTNKMDEFEIRTQIELARLGEILEQEVGYEIENFAELI